MAVVVITGATGALGAATAAAALAAGHTVFGLDRVAPEEAVAAGLHDRPLDHATASGYRHVCLDVTDPHALESAVARIDVVHHLVCIAGGALDEPALGDDPGRLSPQRLRDTLELNLVGPYTCVWAFLDTMRASSGDRSVTFTSTINAQRGIGLHGYAAAKAGLESLVRTLCGPLGADGIRVNAIAPGTVATPRTARAWAHDPDHFPKLAATTALGRLPQPSEIADAYLAAMTLTHLSGQTITVDGGQTVRWQQ